MHNGTFEWIASEEVEADTLISETLVSDRTSVVLMETLLVCGQAKIVASPTNEYTFVILFFSIARFTRTLEY